MVGVDGIYGGAYNKPCVSLLEYLSLYVWWYAVMRNRFRQKMTSLLLSALVLVLGVVPPGVEHAHAGGENSSHQHDKCHETAHNDLHSSHSHDHHSSEKHHEHKTAPADKSRLADLVSHLHWQFFGIDFSMLIPEKPANNTDDEENLPPAVIRAMEDVVPAIQAGPSFGRMLLAATCTLNVVDVVWSQEPVPRPSNLVTTIPLCDSARLERSGVLLS